MVESQANSLSGFSKSGRAIICSLCVGGVHSPYTEQTLATRCTPIVWSKYQKMREDVVARERDSKHQAEKTRLENEQKDEILKLTLQYEKDATHTIRRDAEIERHRHHITNNVLTNLCPSCHLVIDDFEGCFAIHHQGDVQYRDDGGVMRSETVGCLGFFCGWCHQLFNMNKDCHDHVKVCPRSLHPGSYHGTMDEYYATRAIDRKAEIERYLVRNNVVSDFRRALLEKMRKDLNDVKINFQRE